jgi:hypothetical protein
MRRLQRGAPGMQEVPVLKELNDIREKYTGHDLSVLDRDTFLDVADTLTLGHHGQQDLEDAYLQLHLIVDGGGSHAPQWQYAPAITTKQTKNSGKYDISRTALDQRANERDDVRSREALAVAMLRDNELMPTITNAEFLQDTTDALQRFVTSTSLGSPVLGNSGVRTKYKQDDPGLMPANVQMWNDLSSGYDRLSGDFIGNQKIEFGHVYPADLGGSDALDNGRAQAKHANHATGKRLGVEGALSALGPKYKQYKKKYAGEDLSILPYLYPDIGLN